MMFWVASAGEVPTPLEGVDTLVILKNGDQWYAGKTDGAGTVEISRSLLEERGRAVLFCHEWFFCGSFLTSEEDFFKYEERYINLAAFAFM